MNNNYDIIIIGAGAVGCAIARELSRYKVSIAVLEKESDVAASTSGRNSAVVHAGFNNKPGSLMAKLCVQGNKGFEQICKTLDVPYKKTGKLLVAFDDDDLKTLQNIIKRGIENGCSGLKLISKSELEKTAPNVGGIGGMFSKDTAIFDPFMYCIALAENAAVNGVKFFFEHKVIKISGEMGNFIVSTPKDDFSCKFIINCAGLYADNISKMAGIYGYKIYPCRGEYYILDKIANDYLSVPVYPVPKAGIGGLGVHLTPTVDGNIIIGPSAEYINEKDDYSCTAPVMEKLFSEAKQLLPILERRHIIGNYSGIRPKQAPPNEGGYRDFVIKEEEQKPGFINLVGIESPGLTASVPISYMVRDIISKKIKLVLKPDFIENRVGVKRFRDCSIEEQVKLIESESEYGEIVCRCQKVTKYEIRKAVENILGVKSISGIKYRAWATTGRCNGGYCLSRIVDILINEYNMKPEEIKYRSSGSEMFAGTVK